MLMVGWLMIMMTTAMLIVVTYIMNFKWISFYSLNWELFSFHCGKENEAAVAVFMRTSFDCFFPCGCGLARAVRPLVSEFNADDLI